MVAIVTIQKDHQVCFLYSFLYEAEHKQLRWSTSFLHLLIILSINAYVLGAGDVLGKRYTSLLAKTEAREAEVPAAMVLGVNEPEAEVPAGIVPEIRAPEVDALEVEVPKARVLDQSRAS